MLRMAIVMLLGIVLVSPAWAGSYTVTADDAVLAALAEQAHLTPQALLQRRVDSLIKSHQRAEMSRALSKAQRACDGGEAKACEVLTTAIKAAPVGEEKGGGGKGKGK